MRVFVTGGTGVIGRRLIERLAARGDKAVVLTRSAEKAGRIPALKDHEIVEGDPSSPGAWEQSLDGCDSVVNLVGQNIFEKRWNTEIKKQLRESRIISTRNVVAAIGKAANRPQALVHASAIGYYGPSGDEELTEASPPGTDFMAAVCKEWEEAANTASAHGTRVVPVRIGVVLTRGDSALGVMEPIFRLGLASPVGSGGSVLLPARGKQWFSWIHLEDIVGIIMLALDRDDCRGPINGTAPEPVRNAEFSRALARALRRGVWPPYLPFGPPDFVLQLMLGEVAQVITTGQRVIPARAQALGYAFQFPTLADALGNLYANVRPSKNADTARAGARA